MDKMQGCHITKRACISSVLKEPNPFFFFAFFSIYDKAIGKSSLHAFCSRERTTASAVGLRQAPHYLHHLVEEGRSWPSRCSDFGVVKWQPAHFWLCHAWSVGSMATWNNSLCRAAGTWAELQVSIREIPLNKYKKGLPSALSKWYKAYMNDSLWLG